MLLKEIQLRTFERDGVLGPWKIPLSSTRPEVLTEARLQIKMRDNTVDAAFSFPDPKPYGIPFTFQGVAIEFLESPNTEIETPGESGQSKVTRLSLDWTDGCSGPGRSLFPGGEWDDSVSDDGMPDAPEAIRVLLWGSRN